MAYTKYSLTPANNNAAPPDGAPEGMLPSAVNDTMRDMMAQIRDCGDGIRGGTYTMTAPVITGGSINNTPIGASTANTGAFTTLSASSTVSGTGFSNYFASPPALGGTAAAAVSSTNLSYTGTLTGGTGVVNLGSGQFYKDASGNVGIGIASPGAKLDVNPSSGTIFRAFTSSIAQIIIGNGGASVNYYDGNTQVFRTGTTGEVMRLDSNGNLLLGSTSSNAIGIPSLEVGGSNGNALITIRRSSTSAAGQIIFYNPNGAVGSVITDGSTTSFNTASDYRLKENIAPMQGALDVVAQLKPVTYNWKADGSSCQGFIAHELQAVVPDCVTGEKDAVDKEGNPVYQGIDTSFLVATLTAAIKEQQVMINELKAKVAALEAA